MNANEIKTGLELRTDLGKWQGQEWYDVYICGRHLGATVGYSRSVERLRACANHMGIDLKAARAAYMAARRDEQGTVEQTPVEAAKAPQKPAQRVRCPHYKAIRRAFAICKERGLDTKADARMRKAFENLLLRPVPSREALLGSDWMLLGDEIKRGNLAW